MLGHGILLLGEYSAVNVLKVLRHHIEPQVKGVPLAIALNLYNVGYGTFAMREYVNRTQLDKGNRSRTLWLGTALVATSLDLLVAPFGLKIGLWEWSSDGAYATEIEGPNAKHGVPLLNFAGWLGLIAAVTLAYQGFDLDGNGADYVRPAAAGSPEAERIAALLLLPYYLPAAV